MMQIWKIYEIPVLLVAILNWLILYVFAEPILYEGFWWIVLFFSAITFMYSALLQQARNKRPVNFFSWFAIGKAIKFFLSVALLLLLAILYPDAMVNSCITVGLLFLVTLIVDTSLFLRFARSLKREGV